MNEKETLIELFKRFPGIGPRQAERFVFFLLQSNPTYKRELAGNINMLGNTMAQCTDCFRFSQKAKIADGKCSLCNNNQRDNSTLMVVAKDVDLENIERAGTYIGKYFVLGGLVSVLGKKTFSRTKELSLLTEKNKDTLSEIIFALSATPDGEHSTALLMHELKDFAKKNNITLSILGRGLSTGSELEYADPETIKNALKGRG